MHGAGSSTAYYMASQIFRFAVTRDNTVRQQSWRHFSALEFLQNVTRPFAKQTGESALPKYRIYNIYRHPSL